MAVRLDDKHVRDFIQPHELEAIQCQVEAAHQVLHQGTGLGNDFLGCCLLYTSLAHRNFSFFPKGRDKPEIRIMLVSSARDIKRHIVQPNDQNSTPTED